MKKILTIALALIVLVCAVAVSGCTDTNTNDDNQNITAPGEENGTELPENGGESEETPDAPEASEENNETNEESTEAGDFSIEGKTPAEIIDAIYAKRPVELAVGTMEIDITDVDALTYNTGLKSADKISAVAVSESMFGSQAYSLVVVKVKDSADAKAVATEMKDNIDQRKWCCVEADDMKVSTKGDVVMLFMVDSKFAESVTAADLANAFKEICGGSVDVEL